VLWCRFLKKTLDMASPGLLKFPNSGGHLYTKWKGVMRETRTKM